MQPSIKSAVLIFLLIAAVLYAGATVIFIAWLWRKVRRTAEPKRSAAAKWTRREVLSLAGGGLACISWGYFIEPYRIEVTRTKIRTPKLRGSSRPIRLVHISDLHCDSKVRNEEKLPGIIAELQPDLIVYTGDSTNSPDNLANFKHCLTRIARVAPTYTCKGNWDTYFPNLDYFGGTGAVELDGTSQRIEVAGTHLWLAGAPVGNQLSLTRRLDRALAEIPPEDFKVFLYHYPGLIYTLANRGIDLHCAGHTHGGQVALPFYGAITTMAQFHKRFEAGLYRVHNTQLYVNRGIGMEGGHAPRVRFWCRPEVSLLEIDNDNA